MAAVAVDSVARAARIQAPDSTANNQAALADDAAGNRAGAGRATIFLR